MPPCGADYASHPSHVFAPWRTHTKNLTVMVVKYFDSNP